MKPSVLRLLNRYYPPGTDGHRILDTDKLFYDWLLGSLSPQARVLNVGAGPTPLQEERRIRGKVAEVIGVDPDPVVLTNTDLDSAYVNDGVHLPFEADSFDAAYSDWTMEHVAQPLAALREIHRVLRPGSGLWFRTNNARHYAVLVSAVTPQSFHKLIFKANRPPGSQHEPWPTRYRLNTRKRISRTLRAAGFGSLEIRMVESNPGAYLSFSPALFLLGVGYERLVNASRVFEGLRFTALVKAQKV